MEECELRKRVQGLGLDCDQDNCVFWAELGLGGEGARPQCALQYFRLLDARGAEFAEWLLSLKEEQIAEVLGLKKVPPETE